MGIADSLERELPYLRRYARAVAGGGMQGDALVDTALAPLRQSGDETLDRVGFFVRVEDTIRASLLNKTETADLDPASRSRRALLLTAVEGFPVSDAATIMRCDTAEIGQLVHDAEQDLTEALATTVFIIEDEPLVAAHITQIAAELGHTVIGQAITLDQAVERCLALKPKLLLADVQLADGSSGADAAAIITETLDIPVVFITAHPQKLLTGRAGEPVYLIPKPFRPDMVKAVIGQALLQNATVRAARN